MKWVRMDHAGQPTFGILQESTIQVTANTWEDILSGKPAVVTGEIPRETAVLLNPVPRPGKIICVGLNYLDHCRETNTPPPERPLLFTKFTTAMTGPTDDIIWSAAFTSQVDFEAELAVIIGKTARHVSEAEALGYVAGYTAANDVSARDVQLGDGQWVRGKSLDTFCPMGPTLVTTEEIRDPQSLAIRSLLNGNIMQDSNTNLMIFPVAEQIAFCSNAFTLEPGDVILTGTPHGVGLGREPQIFMQHGDVITVELEGIGRISNRCRVHD